MTEQSKAEMMRRLRKERREQGLVEFRAWVKPAIKEKLAQTLKKLNKT